MKHIKRIIGILATSTFLSLTACETVNKPQNINTQQVNTSEFQLFSKDIVQNQVLDINQVFNGFGCQGKNVSPQLNWQNAPEGTKSFAVTMYDPDAPTGSGWWHWLVVNIPKKVNNLGNNESFTNMPNVIQTRTDYGTKQFGGACPPVGDQQHRYQVTIWALDVETLPNVTEDSSGALVGYFLNKHKLAKSTITALYQR